MRLHQLTEKSHYEKNRTCKTPDTIYSTKINGKKITVSVDLPFDPALTTDKSQKLEADLHYAFEKVLASLFK